MNTQSRLVAMLAAAILASACSGPPTSAPPSHTFEVRDGRFLYDGQPFQIRSGSIHYSRVPRAYWQQRLEMAKAMGLNTVTTYVFWNLSEPKPGEFDFEGRRDVAAFVRLAGALGLHVVVRPGPYVCSEWELGGIPSWLLADSSVVVRTRDSTYLAAARRWIERVGRELAPLQITRGGPIIGVQVENEYGSFGDDSVFMRDMADDYAAAGFDPSLFFTSDGPGQLPRGSLAGIRAVVNFGPGYADSAFAALHRFRPNDPLMSGEYWAGWFDGWGVEHHTTDAAREASEIGWMLDQGGSFNLYMFHAGTSFGFMSGANFYGGAYAPQTTSYDYDGALDEAGHITPKYRAFREVIAAHLPPGDTLPTPPSAPPVIAVPSFELSESTSLFDALPEPVHRTTPEPMERLGQAYGFILYRTQVEGPLSGALTFDTLNGYGSIYLDHEPVGTVDLRLKQRSAQVDVPAGTHTLDILVENDGRINFGPALTGERKGITGNVRLAGRELTGWDVYSLPMDDVSDLAYRSGAAAGPAFYHATFDVDDIGDTFLDLRGWGKGVVWVNGHNLGRFWGIGPQQTLYLPGPWLHEGANDVVVFTLDAPERPTLRGLTEPILDDLRVGSR